MKRLITIIFTAILLITSISLNINKLEAANYKVEIVRGYGKNVGNERATYVLNNPVDTGYSFYGYFSGGEVDQEGSNSTRRYSQKTSAEDRVTGVDVYYGNQVIYNTTNGVFLKEDGSLAGTVSSNSTRLLKYAISNGSFMCRFYYVGADMKLVLHYADEDELRINNVDSTYINDVYEEAYKKDDTYLLSKSLNYSDGFEVNVKPLDKELDIIDFNIGDKTYSLTRLDDTYYLSKEHVFSNQHNNDDILAYKDNNIIIYNFYEPIDINYRYKYNVTFDALNGKFDDGSSIKEEVINLGKVDFPIDPIKDGYEFGGWYDRDDYKVTDNRFYEDTLLHAAYSKKLHTITYDYNGLKENEIDTVGDNCRVKETIADDIDGYAFLGWYSDKDYTKKYDFNNYINNDVTIYALYKKAIIVKINNANGISSNNFIERVGENGIVDEENNKVILFDGYKNDKGLNVSINSLEGKIKGIDITIGNKKINIKENDLDNNKVFYIKKFLFWLSKSSNQSNNDILKISHTNKGNNDDAYTLNLYNISEDVDIYLDYGNVELTYVLDNKEYVKKLPYNSLVDIDVPEKDNSVFTGWYLDSQYTNAYDLDKPVTSDMTLYGKYEGIHTLTFNENVIRIVSNKWNELTGGEINNNDCTLNGDFHNKSGLKLDIATDVAKLKKLVIEYGGYKLEIDKDDIYEMHSVSGSLELEKRSNYVDNDLFRFFTDHDAISTISFRFFNIIDDMKISVIY